MSIQKVSIGPGGEEAIRRLVQAHNTVPNIYLGSVTLTANASSTTVTLPSGEISKDSVILFEPTTANAAAEIGAGGMYRSATDVAARTFTITHANNAQTDRSFNYVIIG